MVRIEKTTLRRRIASSESQQPLTHCRTSVHRPGERAGRVEIGPVVNADAEAVNELTAEPSSHESNGHGDGSDHDGKYSGGARRRPSQPPTSGKQGHHDDITNAMQQADTLRARASGDGEEVDQSEDCRRQSRNDA